jgi:hypothetical protein
MPITKLLEIDKEMIKVDDEGKLMIDEQNIGYLMSLLEAIEKKFNDLYLINKHLTSDAGLPKVV